jgi:hypothetical protein
MVKTTALLIFIPPIYGENTCQKLKIMVLLSSFIPGIKLENGILLAQMLVQSGSIFDPTSCITVFQYLYRMLGPNFRDLANNHS